MSRPLAERLNALPRVVLPVVVGMIALAIRAWVLLDQRADNPLFTLAILDDRTYLDLAAGLHDGGDGRPWFLAPLHPWLLSLFSEAPTMLTASCLNVAAGTLTAAAAAWVSRDLHSAAAGWGAGLLVALAGTFVFHDTLPGQEPVLALLHVLGFALAMRWLKDGSYASAGAVGVVAGVAATGRATSLAILLAAAFLVVLRLRPRGLAWRGVVVALAGLAAVLVPLAMRNNGVTGDFTPLPWSGGVNLYMANGPEARETTSFGARELGMAPDAMAERARAIAEENAGRELRPSEVSAYWSGRARAESGGVGEMTGHFVRKAGLFFAASEYGNNHYVVLERRYATWLAVVPVTGWWLLALGVGGWWIVRRKMPAADVAALVVAITWALLTVVYPVSRYRLPVLPLAAVVAACGVAEALRTDDGRRRVVAGALVIAVGVIAHLDGVLRAPPAAVSSYVNLATALAREERDAEAEAILREALDGWPEDGVAHLELGRVLQRAGRHGDALAAFERAEADARTQWTAGVPALYSLVHTGQAEQAEQVARVLFEKLPPDPALRTEFLAWWALAAGARGDAASARTRLLAARKAQADHPAVLVAERELGSD